MNPLCKAAHRGEIDKLHSLVKEGNSIHESDVYRLTPLHYAASAGKIDCVIFLLKQGANINAQNIGGLTPVSQAASSGYYSVVRYLLERGADPSIADFSGRTALHWARHYHQHNCVFVLEEYFSKSKNKNSDISCLDEDLENQCAPVPSNSTFSDWRTLQPSQYNISEMKTTEGKRIYYKYGNKKQTLPTSIKKVQDPALEALFKALEKSELPNQNTKTNPS